MRTDDVSADEQHTGEVRAVAMGSLQTVRDEDVSWLGELFLFLTRSKALTNRTARCVLLYGSSRFRRVLVTGDEDGRVIFRDADTFRVVRMLSNDPSMLYCVEKISLSSCGTRCAVCYSEPPHGASSIQVWNLEKGYAQRTLYRHIRYRSIVYSADLTICAWVPLTARCVRIYHPSASTFGNARIVTFDTEFVENIALSCDGRWLAVALRGGRIEVWSDLRGSLSSIAMRYTLNLGVTLLRSVDISNTLRLVTGDAEGKVQVWRITGTSTAALLGTYNAPSSHPVRHVAISPIGCHVVSVVKNVASVMSVLSGKVATSPSLVATLVTSAMLSDGAW